MGSPPCTKSPYTTTYTTLHYTTLDSPTYISYLTFHISFFYPLEIV